jgi:hypothetical protein
MTNWSPKTYSTKFYINIIYGSNGQSKELRSQSMTALIGFRSCFGFGFNQKYIPTEYASKEIPIYYYVKK